VNDVSRIAPVSSSLFTAVRRTGFGGSSQALYATRTNQSNCTSTRMPIIRWVWHRPGCVKQSWIGFLRLQVMVPPSAKPYKPKRRLIRPKGRICDHGHPIFSGKHGIYTLDCSQPSTIHRKPKLSFQENETEHSSPYCWRRWAGGFQGHRWKGVVGYLKRYPPGKLWRYAPISMPAGHGSMKSIINPPTKIACMPAVMMHTRPYYGAPGY